MSQLASDNLPTSRVTSPHNRFRVLVVTNMFPHSADPARGAFVKAQVDALVETGCTVEVFHIRGDISASNYWYAINKVRAVQRRFEPEIVYAFYGLSGWVCQWQPAPVVLSLAGDDVLGTPNGRGGLTLKSRLGIALSNWAAARAAVVCVQSQQMRDRLWGRALRRRALIIPYGVDENRFRPGSQEQARKRLGLPPTATIVLFPSTPTERRKRLDLARQAMTIVETQFANAVLQVVAGAPHENMPDYYRAADCCLLTSDWEGSPNVVKEALLSGLPVVSTDVGDVREWLELSPGSIICDRTPSGIAMALLSVLRDRRRIDPRPYVKHFSSSSIALKMTELFASVVAKGEPPVDDEGALPVRNGT